MFNLVFTVLVGLMGFFQENAPPVHIPDKPPASTPVIQQLFRYPIATIKPGDTVVMVLRANNCNGITYQVRMAGGPDLHDVTYVCRDGLIVLMFKAPPQTVTDADIQIFVNGGPTNGSYSGTIHVHNG